MADSVLGAVLPDISFVQGSTTAVHCEFFNDKNEPRNLSSSICELRICPFGQYKNPVLTLVGTVSTTQTNYVVFPITLKDTQYLSTGKYEYMPVAIYDDNGVIKEYMQGRGNLFLQPRIDSNITH